MRPAQDLVAILAEARTLKPDLEALRNVQKPFTIRTSNEIDELSAKVKQEPTPGQKNKAKILLAFLAANNDKMLASIRDYIEVRPFHAKTK